MSLEKDSLIRQQNYYMIFYSMRLYIDKENIESLIKGRKENLELYSELARYIKRGLLVQYNFSKDDMLKNQYLQAWFSTVGGDGVTSKPDFCPPQSVFPMRPVKTNFLSSCGSDAYRSIYLLCTDENISKNLKEKQAILIGNVGEEYTILEQLQTLEDKEILTKQINSWGSYCPKLPLTDIILCDEHYFKHKYVYEKNKNEILSSLCKTPKNQINIVIITKDGDIDPALDLEKEWKNIKEQVSKASGLSKGKCNVTILTTNKTHSRHLITNYYRIIHTCCFHLEENGLKGDVNTDIAPCTNKNANAVTEDLIKLFQGIATSPVHCYGDKFSNFLIF